MNETLPHNGRVDDYRLIRRVGRGGMGEVFLAEDLTLAGRHVALKVIRGGVDREAQDRFAREIAALAKLNHRNIVTPIRAGHIDGNPYLVMEWLEGADLYQHVRQGPCDFHAVCMWLLQVIDGLQAIHACGIVHRDLKPANLFLTTDQTVKILDLGLVRLAENSGRPTEPSDILGTLDYVSPEQCALAGQVGYQTDYYALGCTIFHLLTGQPPYADHARVSKIHAHVSLPFPSMLQKNAQVPVELDAVVQRLCAKKMIDRPTSLDELARLLKEIEQNLPVSSAETVSIPALLSDTSQIRASSRLRNPQGVSASLEEDPRQRPRKRTATVAVVVGLCIVLVMLLLFIVWGRDKNTPPSTLATGQTEESKATTVAGQATPPQAKQTPPGSAAKPFAGLSPLPPPSGARDDRVIAEWLLQNGGRVFANHGGRTWQEFNTVDDLPDETIGIVQLDFEGLPINDATLKHLQQYHVPEVESLILNLTNVTDAGLQFVLHWSLTDLSLKQLRITDQGMRTVEKWKDLSSLNLEDTAITDDAIPSLLNLSRLRRGTLSIDGTQITEQGIQRLQMSFPQLELITD